MDKDQEKKIVLHEEQAEQKVLDGETLTKSDHKSPESNQIQNFTKEIPITDVPEAVKLMVKAALEMLTTLKKEIEEKRNLSLEKRNFIKSKIEQLKVSGKVNIDEEEFLKSNASVEEFTHLLDGMIKEIENDMAFYASLFSANSPTNVIALRHESDNFELFLKNRILLIKKYTKNAKRDLAISFSRYSLGFDAQIRQITLVERALLTMQTSPLPNS